MANRVDISGEARQVGNYRLITLLSSGQEACLYLAEHMHLKTQVLLKLYGIRLQASDQESFLTEVRAVAHLVHPHIARVLEFGIEKNAPFLVLSYAPGGTLRQRHPTGVPLPLPTILGYVKQIADALDYAHHQQVLHLDLKPENVWLNQNNEIVLSNFRITLFSRSSHSQSIQEIANTAAYMAPEQIMGHPGPASDQYALGVLVYEWLSGSRPFLSTNYVEIARQHMHILPPALTGKTNPAVEQVVMRALAKEASERFPTVQAFAEALEQSYHSPKSGRMVKDRSTRRENRETSTAFDPSLRQPGAGRRFTRRYVVSGIAIAAGTAVIGGGISFWSSHHSPPTKPQLPTKPAPIGTTLHVYKGHVDSVYCVSWSRDGKSIASCSRDDTMQIWNAATLQIESTYQVENVLSWSPDWRYIATGDAYHFQVWENGTGRIIIDEDFPRTGGGPGTLPADRSLWSPDGRYFVTPASYTEIWNVMTGKVLSSYPAGNIAWSTDSKRMALAPIDYTAAPNAPVKIRVLELLTENQLASYSIPTGNTSPGVTGFGTLAWSPDGKYLSSGNGNIWDALKGQQRSGYKGKVQIASGLPSWWSPNSKYIASIGSLAAPGGQINNVVCIWDARTGKDVFIYHGHSASINDLDWSPDGTKITSASNDKTVRVWQAV
jgi:serine/threonine protein kinase